MKTDVMGNIQGCTVKKAAIVIDRWKLAIFTRHFKQAGFAYEEVGPITSNTLTLTVIVAADKMQALVIAVQAAQHEARRTKR